MRSVETPPVSSPDGFEAFVATHERRLRQALTASFGIDRGREAAADALAYAWEHWDRVAAMANPAGYLFVVGRDRDRRRFRNRVTKTGVRSRAGPPGTVVRAGVGGSVGGAVGSGAGGGDAGQRVRLVTGRGRRVPGCVEEHGADPCRAGDGQAASGDGGDVMTIEEQLRALARHADQHQPVITAAEILQRASGRHDSTASRRHLTIAPPAAGRNSNQWRRCTCPTTQLTTEHKTRWRSPAVAAAAIVVLGVGAMAFAVSNTNADDPDGVPQAPAPTAAPTTAAPTTTVAPRIVTVHGDPRAHDHLHRAGRLGSQRRRGSSG